MSPIISPVLINALRPRSSLSLMIVIVALLLCFGVTQIGLGWRYTIGAIVLILAATVLILRRLPQRADDRPAIVNPEGKPKDIILFSDGTGNSSSKLFRTNVWRLYETLDLGPGADRAQIAYYDNGVGTSTIPTFAALGGIFGFGLARNVRDIYCFLCRNYQPGDRIYAFGFSRGSFTIRLLVDMVAREGIVDYVCESDLQNQARDVWRGYRENFKPNQWSARIVTAALRWTMRMIITAKRWLFGERGFNVAKRELPDIDFVGVWDTVAAYGGPIIEITRGIDEFVWPLTMSGYALNKKIRIARHALALDDQRDAFQPLLWDEIIERNRAESAAIRAEAAEKKGDDAAAAEARAEEQFFKTRVEQVWFTGMHADVGGGYPDESLSYVSLIWMIDHARRAGLRFLPESEKRYRDMANIFGPIHDSRSGFSAFYRYQPRKIAAWQEHAGESTLVYRDPTITEGQYRTRGLLVSPVKVHSSVIERIRAGTDNYAPINLPPDIAVVGAVGSTPQPLPYANAAANIGAIEQLWDQVWGKRWAYFLCLWLVGLLLWMPWWPQRLKDFEPFGYPLVNGGADARIVTGPFTALAQSVLPAFANRWIEVFAVSPVTFLAIILAILLIMAISTSLEQDMNDRAADLWWSALGLQPAPQFEVRHGGIVRAIREHRWYQWALAKLKWRILPFFVGLAMLAVILFTLVVAITQTWLSYAEEWDQAEFGSRYAYCRTYKAKLPPIEDIQDLMIRADTNNPCMPTGAKVKLGETYTVNIAARGWNDDGITGHPAIPGKPAEPANPEGITADEYHYGRGYLGAPFRRVVTAPYFAVLYEVRSPKGAVLIGRLDPRRLDKEDEWYATFKAPADGALYFFLNDAMLPLDPTTFRFFDLQGRYGNNNGDSCLLIRPGLQPQTPAIERGKVGERCKFRVTGEEVGEREQ